MKNVPPNVRAALKRRGAEQILEQEGDYQTFKPQIDQILHKDDNQNMSDDVLIPDYEADLSPEDNKALDEIEKMGQKYKNHNSVKPLSKINELMSSKEIKKSNENTDEWKAMVRDYGKRGIESYYSSNPYYMNREEFNNLLNYQGNNQKENLRRDFANKYKDLIEKEISYREGFNNDYNDYKNSDEYKHTIYDQLLADNEMGVLDFNRKLINNFNKKYNYDLDYLETSMTNELQTSRENYKTMSLKDYEAEYGNDPDIIKKWYFSSNNYPINNKKSLNRLISNEIIDIYDLINYVKGKK